jgi:cytochrome c553
VAACSGCHEASRTGPFPTLQGQYVRHLRTQLALFATEMERGGGPFATLMAKSSHSLEPADIDAVSAWYASKVPKPE